MDLDPYYYGEAEDYTLNVRNPILRDAALTAFTSPVVPFTSGSKAVTVTLKNIGSTSLNWYEYQLDS